MLLHASRALPQSEMQCAHQLVQSMVPLHADLGLVWLNVGNFQKTLPQMLHRGC